MSEWIDVKGKLPKDGEHVSIMIIGGGIHHNVLYEHSRFWKLKVGINAGIAWEVLKWAYPKSREKIKEAKENKDVFEKDVHQEK